MKHSVTFKRHLLPATLLLLSTSLTTGCGLDSGHTFGDIFGETRTLPDGDNVNFNNRHAPILNPTPTTSVTGGPQSNMQNTPVGNNTATAGTGMSNTVATPTMALSGRHVPVENENVMAGNGPVAANAPATAYTMPVAAQPLPPMQTTSTTAPTLADIPQVPSTTSAKQNTADLKSMIGEQNQSELSRQQLVNNSSATVMTSPQTGQLIDNAATAPVPPAGSFTAADASNANMATMSPPAPAKPPQPAPSPQPGTSSGFGAWLHHLFHSDTPAASRPAATTASNTAPRDTMAIPGGEGSPAEGSISSAPLSAPPLSASVSEPPAVTVHAAPASGADPMAGATEVTPNMMLSGTESPPSVAPSAAPPSQTFTQPAVQTAPAQAPFPARASTSSSDLSVPPAPQAPMQPMVVTDPPTDIVHLTPPVSAESPPAVMPSPAPAANPAPSTAMTPPPVSAQSAVPSAVSANPPANVVHLTAPNTANTSGLPDVSQISAAHDEPINLVPPSESGTSSSDRFLPDSRYAARRSQTSGDDSNN